jgi:hypothetical protein
MIRCVDVTAIVVSRNRATIFGRALAADLAVGYRMDVIDVDESGRSADAWSIRTSSGYVAGGTLTEGNVQVRE